MPGSIHLGGPTHRPAGKSGLGGGKAGEEERGGGGEEGEDSEAGIVVGNTKAGLSPDCWRESSG